MRSLAIMSVFFICGIASAQEDRKPLEMFSISSLDELKTDKQKEIYARLSKLPSTKAIAIYHLNNIYGAVGFAQEVNIRFELKKGEPVAILGCTPKTDKDRRKTVVTLEKEGKDAVIITVRNDTATGLIYSGKKVYSVEPLGDYRVAIIELDQTKFPKD